MLIRATAAFSEQPVFVASRVEMGLHMHGVTSGEQTQQSSLRAY